MASAVWANKDGFYFLQKILSFLFWIWISLRSFDWSLGQWLIGFRFCFFYWISLFVKSFLAISLVASSLLLSLLL